VQTGKLQATFDKYLPAVLNTGAEKKAVKPSLTESKMISEITGDKSAKQDVVETEERDITPIVERRVPLRPSRRASLVSSQRLSNRTFDILYFS
jgi:hypothetical protein